MCAEIEAGRPDVAAAMAAPVRALLGVLASSGTESPRRLDDLKAVARARLADPALRAADVAAVFGASDRTVQAEFAATACGFRDPTHFHGVFRGRFETTPGELRAGR